MQPVLGGILKSNFLAIRTIMIDLTATRLSVLNVKDIVSYFVWCTYFFF